jgi:4-amino-4-deoxy-L-arabinose transferase-like glycosyltransferase
VSTNSARKSGISRFPWRIVSGGVLVYLVLQALFVGIPGISGSSEAREVQVVDVIVREGTWTLPLRNGIIPSKPPLYHWLAASLSLALGEVSEFTARFTSQLCAAAGLVVVSLVTFCFAAKTRSDQGHGHPRRAALLSIAILSLTYGFYQLGCQAMVDMTFTLCVWLALGALALSCRCDASARSPVTELGRTLFWLFCSVGVLARGPLALVLPVALAGVAGWCALGFTRTVRLFLRPSFGWFMVVIPVAWYYLAYLVGGEAFLERQLFFENIKRFSGGEFVNSESWWFYLPSVLRTTFPWGLVLLGVFVATVARPQTLSYPEAPRRIRWLPLILLGVGIGLLSLSSGKRHSYLLPLLPLVAIQLAVELSTMFERGGDRARARAVRVGRITEITLTTAAMLLLIALGIFGEFFATGSGYLSEAYAALPIAISRLSVLILGCALVAFVGMRRQLSSLYSCVWCLMLILMTGAVAVGAAVKAHLKGFEQISVAWLATAAETERLAVFKHPFDEYFDPILYYVHRPVTILPLEAVSKECTAGTVYAAKRAWLDAHEGLFKGQLVRVLTARERLAARKGDGSRDMVFFRCGTFGNDREGFESPLMHDAVYSR